MIELKCEQCEKIVRRCPSEYGELSFLKKEKRRANE